MRSLNQRYIYRLREMLVIQSDSKTLEAFFNDAQLIARPCGDGEIAVLIGGCRLVGAHIENDGTGDLAVAFGAYLPDGVLLGRQQPG